jgi:hypothetical protein
VQSRDIEEVIFCTVKFPIETLSPNKFLHSLLAALKGIDQIFLGVTLRHG